LADFCVKKVPMVENPQFLERKPFVFSEMFHGNWGLFGKVISNPETNIVYDIDGILIDTPKIVLKRFTEKTGIKTDPAEINDWNYLGQLAMRFNLDQESIDHANGDWYKPEVLKHAKRYLHIKPLVQTTLNYHGPDKNFVLTSRNPDFKETTISQFAHEFPEIKSENILIRDSGGVDNGISSSFKVENIRKLAQKARWVLFVDDQPDFCEAVLKSGVENCLVINIPLGAIKPALPHDRLIVMGRFPNEIQAMYPFKYAVDKALRDFVR